MAMAIKTRKAGKKTVKGNYGRKPTKLSKAQKQALNQEAERALGAALSNLLCGRRSIGDAWAVVRCEVDNVKRDAIEHHYEENFDEFLDASGWSEEDVFENWQDEEGNLSDEDRCDAIADAVFGFVQDMCPEQMTELLDELADLDHQGLAD